MDGGIVKFAGGKVVFIVIVVVDTVEDRPPL